MTAFTYVSSASQHHPYSAHLLHCKATCTDATMDFPDHNKWNPRQQQTTNTVQCWMGFCDNFWEDVEQEDIAIRMWTQ